MGLLAVHHLDPVIGIDVHTVTVPPAVPPAGVPMPHPHVGLVLDFREYLDAALGVIGSIAFSFVLDFAIEYLENNPDVVDTLAGAANATISAIGVAADVTGVSTALGVAKAVADIAGVPKALDAAAKAVVPAAMTALEISESMGAGVGTGGFLPARPVLVNGFLRASAGTHTYHVPGLHFPLGVGFALKDLPRPSSDAESFMGSRTVLASKDPLSYMALLALSCWFIGMVPMKHFGSHTNRFYLSMPTSVLLPIPVGRPVLVGGTPIFNMFFALGALFKACKAFRGSAAAIKLANKLKLKSGGFKGGGLSGFLRCAVLKAEPVNTITGEVYVPHNDFTIEGRLPLAWDRSYFGHDTHDGAVGASWQTPADIRLELMGEQGQAYAVAHFPDYATPFEALPKSQGWENRVYDLQHGHALYLLADRLVLRTRASLEYHYPLPVDWEQRIKALHASTETAPSFTLPLNVLTDLNGNAWQFERDKKQVLTRLIEWNGKVPTGRVIQCEAGNLPGKLGRLTLTDAENNSYPLTRYEQDMHGDLIAVYDALDRPYCFAYEAGHRMIRHTDRNGLSFYYSYQLHSDNLWRVDHAWGDGGLYDYRFVYDLEHLETRSTDSLGHTTILQYNDQNLPVASIDPLGGVSSYQYDGQGRTQAEIDPSGNITTWAYDIYGNLLSTVLPDGSAVSTAYNDDHKPVAVTDPEGGQWRREWDERGNLTGQTTPSGAATQYEYTEQGDLLHVIDPAKQCTTLHHDALGFLAGLTDAAGQRTEFEHDTRGNLLRKQLANGDVTHYRYDAKNRLLESILPDTRRIQCAYNAEDELTRYRDEASRVTQFSYYGLGQLQSRTDPDGSKVEYHYDTEERLIAVTNQRGQRWQLKRDAAGRLVEEIDYWGQSRKYDYNPAGHLIRSTDPLGQILAFTCDKLGRIVKKQASEQDAETYQFNKRGQLTQAQNPFSTIKRQYNKDGQLTQEIQKQADTTAASVDYAYNPAGQQVEQTRQIKTEQAEFKQTQRTAYNALGQPESVQIDDHEPIRFTFDAIGQLTQQQLNPQLAHHYRYNAAGQLSAQAGTLNGQLDTRIDYDYDDAGNLIRRNDNRLGIDQYRYDLLGQITAHTDPTGHVRQFVYDKTGDRFKTPQQNEQGRTLQHEDGSTWRLDQAGQLVHKRDADARDTHLRWDAYGRLRHLMNPEQDRFEYRYDVLGRRICKIKADRAQRDIPMETTWFVWDEDVMVGEVKQARESASQSQPSCQQAQFYTCYLDSFVPLAMQVHEPQEQSVKKSLYFYQNDPNGMPVRLQDGQGKILWEAYYSAFGRTEDFATRRADQPLKLQGQYRDEESGLYYNRHRYYDAAAGCFISSDPIGLDGGLNPYQFAPNVLGWIDPSGLASYKSASAQRMRDAGLGDLNLAGRSFNNARKKLEALGFAITGRTKTGRVTFEHPTTGTRVTYDGTPRSLVPGQKPHFEITELGGTRLTRSGRTVSGESPIMGGKHIPGKR